MLSFALRLMLISLVLSPASSFAAPLRDQGKRLDEERRSNQLKEHVQRLKPGMEVKTSPVKKTGEEQQCFLIKTIIVEGVKTLKAERVSAVTNPHLNKCLGPKAIEGITQKITNIYIEKGYITTRTYIPQQDISKGVLKLKVIEGFIEGITYFEQRGDGEDKKKKTNKKPGPDSIINTSFPTKPGDLLILRHIEQGIDQINRVPSSTASLDIKPGKKPGGSILEITNKVQDKYRGNVKYSQDRYQNYVSKRMDVTLEGDNLLDLNDSWYMAYSGSDRSNALSYNVSMPFRYWSFSSSGSYSEQVSQLTPTAEQYTQTASLSIAGDVLVRRDRTSKAKLSASLAHKWNYRYINATQLTPHELTVLRIGGSYEKFMPGHSFSVSPGLSVGLPFLATEDSNVKGAPQSNFIKIDGTIYNFVSLDNALTLYTAAYAQYSPLVLYSSEQMGLGGSTSVRGFAQVAAAGEAGFYAQNELSAPLSYFTKKLNLELPQKGWLTDFATTIRPYAFLDVGTSFDQANKLKYWMVGGGVGLRYSKDRINLDANISKPLLHGWDVTNPDGVEANISVTFKLF